MALLPVAPRPFPGELLASWLDRVACIYDMAGTELWAELVGSAGNGSTADTFDRGGGVSLLEPLAEVAAAARVSAHALRGMTTYAMLPAAPRTWLRSGMLSACQVPWCRACLSDDLVYRGVPYLRRLWALGCVVVCSRHHLPLTDLCPGCGRAVFSRFRWKAGRPTMVCDTCDADLAIGESRGTSSGEPGRGPEAGREVPVPFEAVVGAARVQAALLRALRRRAPQWPSGVPPETFIAGVEDLLGLLAFPLGIVRQVAPVAAAGVKNTPQCSLNHLSVRGAFAALAGVAALLALSEADLNPASHGGLLHRYCGGDPADLTRLWLAPDAAAPVLCRPIDVVRVAASKVGVLVAAHLLGDGSVKYYLELARCLPPPPPIPVACRRTPTKLRRMALRRLHRRRSRRLRRRRSLHPGSGG
jgi:hypothetical protein